MNSFYIPIKNFDRFGQFFSLFWAHKITPVFKEFLELLPQSYMNQTFLGKIPQFLFLFEFVSDMKK